MNNIEYRVLELNQVDFYPQWYHDGDWRHFKTYVPSNPDAIVKFSTIEEAYAYLRDRESNRVVHPYPPKP